MLGKIINGEFKGYDGRPVSVYIANPTDEQLKLVGYKPLVEEKQPEYNEAAQMLVEHYEETDENIIKSYEVVEIEDESGVDTND